MRALLAAIGVILTLAAVAIGWLSYAAAGPLGVVYVAICVLGCAGLSARALVAKPPAPPVGDGPASSRPETPPFPTFREVLSMFSWMESSRTFFDRMARPRLWQLIVDTAADRHGPRAGRDIDALKAHIGPELWPLVDPGIPQWTDPPWGREKGPDAATIARLIDRIERI